MNYCIDAEDNYFERVTKNLDKTKVEREATAWLKDINLSELKDHLEVFFNETSENFEIKSNRKLNHSNEIILLNDSWILNN